MIKRFREHKKRFWNKKYIGATMNKPERFNIGRGRIHQHLDAAFNKESNKILYRAMRKYGIESFKWRIVEEVYVDSKLSEKEKANELTEREQHWMDYYKTLGRMFGYNLREAGNQGRMAESTKKKISKKLKGVKKAPFTEEHKNNLRLANLGKKLSIESKLKLSKSLKGKNNGRKHTLESRLNMSKAHIGIKDSEETKKNKSIAMKKRFEDPEERKKHGKSVSKEKNYWYGTDGILFNRRRIDGTFVFIDSKEYKNAKKKVLKLIKLFTVEEIADIMNTRRKVIRDMISENK